ncbi:MAG: hypothetical protein JW734_10010 [Candidatus Omnitrophica bacterium]|nr:hypothetical protein [Candidatus Omnitrophota bacterium]
MPAIFFGGVLGICILYYPLYFIYFLVGRVCLKIFKRNIVIPAGKLAILTMVTLYVVLQFTLNCREKNIGLDVGWMLGISGYIYGAIMILLSSIYKIAEPRTPIKRWLLYIFWSSILMLAILGPMYIAPNLDRLEQLAVISYLKIFGRGLLLCILFGSILGTASLAVSLGLGFLSRKRKG